MQVAKVSPVRGVQASGRVQLQVFARIISLSFLRLLCGDEYFSIIIIFFALIVTINSPRLFSAREVEFSFFLYIHIFPSALLFSS